jgi:Fic family protein
MEEAITSSQLEGASTTHKVAKDMLREKRKPRNKSEQMIYNNYHAMSLIRELKNEKLSKELILILHKIVTEDTLDDKSAAGRFRNSTDEVAVYHEANNLLLHMPPPAEELDERIEILCNFANQEEKKGEFLHPVIRAIILHFMIGYDHPFVDGNGRTARALFYWSMVKQGYWMSEYISISKILKNAPTKYATAYLYTESDEFDMTYFVDFNLRTILRAIESLHEYLARKANEVKNVESKMNHSALYKKLNYRQMALLSHAIRNPSAIYTIETHGNSHNISYPTSRADLLELVELGIAEKFKRGRAFVFKAVSNLQEHLSSLE